MSFSPINLVASSNDNSRAKIHPPPPSAFVVEFNFKLKHFASDYPDVSVHLVTERPFISRFELLSFLLAYPFVFSLMLLFFEFLITSYWIYSYSCSIIVWELLVTGKYTNITSITRITKIYFFQPLLFDTKLLKFYEIIE